MAHNYILQVTAGPSYDKSTHKIVAVNTAKPLAITSPLMSIDLNVRVENYRGLPHSSPPTSLYFSQPAHARNGDQYSIAFRFKPHISINGDDLVFGNDFDYPIRDRLPPGFGAAFRFVKWAIDPGLDGDVFADKPYLYGPLGSSLNIFSVGEKRTGEEDTKENSSLEDEDIGLVFEEGGVGEGETYRRESGIPDGQAARKKWFLIENNRVEWEYEAGREHWADFFNPYLDFNEFALRLPGFTIPIMQYWDGQGLRKLQKRSHTLRYVLRNRKTGTVYLVVLFTLYLKEDVNEDGSIKEDVVGSLPLDGAPKGIEDQVDVGVGDGEVSSDAGERVPLIENGTLFRAPHRLGLGLGLGLGGGGRGGARGTVLAVSESISLSRTTTTSSTGSSSSTTSRGMPGSYEDGE